MATLHTQLNPRSAEFASNSAAMLKQVDALHTLLAQVQQGGGSKAQERHTSRGKLLPRERISFGTAKARRLEQTGQHATFQMLKIGRASCRERV